MESKRAGTNEPKNQLDDGILTTRDKQPSFGPSRFLLGSTHYLVRLQTKHVTKDLIKFVRYQQYYKTISKKMWRIVLPSLLSMSLFRFSSISVPYWLKVNLKLLPDFGLCAFQGSILLLAKLFLSSQMNQSIVAQRDLHHFSRMSSAKNSSINAYFIDNGFFSQVSWAKGGIVSSAIFFVLFNIP